MGNIKREPIKLSHEEEHKLLKEVDQKLKDSRDLISSWRKSSSECYDFYAGEQWNQRDKAQLMSNQRPIIVFNRIVRTISAISGLEIQNRQEPKYLPRKPGDIKVNADLTGAAKWVRDECDAEDEESEAFTDSLICGMGWVDTRLDYEVDYDGKIFMERVDPLEMFWDPNAKKRNLDDAQWIARIKMISKEAFQKIWPDADVEQALEYNDNFVTSYADKMHDAVAAKFYLFDQSKRISKNQLIPVTQYQWYDLETFYRIEEEDGNIKELTTVKYEKMKDIIQEKGLRVLKQKRRVYKQLFKAGSLVLEVGYNAVNEFTIKSITGLRDRNNGVWFGLVHMMRDPQMWANKWMSQILHIINSNAKGGYFAETGIFKNPRDATEELANASSITILNQGGLEKIREKIPPRYPEGIDRLLQYAVQAISDVPGVNLEMLGVQNNNQPGILEYQRKQAAITVLANFFDNLRRYRKNQARLLAEFIISYISDGRLIRVLGDEGAQYIPLLRDNLSLEYDVIIDEAPSSPNQKERVYTILSSILPTIMQSGIPIPPDVLDYLPLPDDLIQKWKQLISSQGNDEETQKNKQIQDAFVREELRKKVLQNEELGSKISLNQAKAVHDTALAHDEESRARLKDEMMASHEMVNMARTHERKDLEMLLGQKRKDEELSRKLARDILINGLKEKS